jgi:hypothetical protein
MNNFNIGFVDKTLHADFEAGLTAIQNNTYSGYFLTGNKSCEINELLDALKKNHSLKELFLRGIALTNQQFISIIKAAKHLERLDLINAYFEDFDAKEISNALNSSSIKALDLSLTNIVEENAKSILQQLDEARRKQTSIALWTKRITLA